jgi:hypothetical protein
MISKTLHGYEISKSRKQNNYSLSHLPGDIFCQQQILRSWDFLSEMVEYREYLKNIKTWIHVIRHDMYNACRFIKGQNCWQNN